VSSTMKLVAASVVALLIGGLSYWILKGSWQSVAPQSSAPPASTAAAPPASPVAPPTMPPTSTAAATSAPLVATSTAPPTSAEAPPAPPASPPTAPPASTAAATSAPPSLPAEANMSEANRRQIQEALRRLDYYKGPVDGIFGTLTRAAIRRFQHEIGADTTGHLTAEEANRLVTSR
jgi:Putative peptidoglycan binding domain